MHRALQRSVDRSLWLAELSAALDEAHVVLGRLGAGHTTAVAHILSIRSRLELAQAEVLRLRLDGCATELEPVGPDWTMFAQDLDQARFAAPV